MTDQPRALTLTESQERARLIAVSSYVIDLDLTRGAEVFGSKTVARFSSSSVGGATFIEVRATRLVSATLNGRRLDNDAQTVNRLKLEDLQSENELVVEADMPYVSTGDGMHRFVDPIDGQTYVGAYLGTDNAQRVFANFDQPDLKATISVSVTAPLGWTVVGNGQQEGLVTEQGRWEFATTPPLSTYLVAVVAGPLHSVRSDHRGTPFALHCRQSLADYLDAEADEIFAITHACFDRYAEIFDEPYPFDSYDQAFVPELNWGALETPGCITFRDDFIYRSTVTEVERQQRGMVIAHEMAHMWFGDMVTMRRWDDLWLSESFAEYMGFQVLADSTRFTDTWTAFAMTTKTWGYDADQRPSTHPVAPDAADVADTEKALENADGITYAKGASALRQLVVWLGEEAFLAGVNELLGRHRFGVATLADLLEALSETSGQDVHRWAQRWLRTTGVDILQVVRNDDSDEGSLAGEKFGDVRIEHPGLRPHRVGLGLYDRDRNDRSRLVLRRRTLLTLPEGQSWTPLDLDDGDRQPDLVLLNDGDLSYAKVRLDGSSWTCVAEGLRHLPNPLSRAVVWTAARDMVRDAELPAMDYLSLVQRHLPSEDDICIVQGVLGFARQHVIDRFLDLSDRTTALAALGGTCRAILERADDTTMSGLRLAALRGLIDAAMSQGDIEELRTYLANDTVPGGPVLDADLRWRVLLRLSVLGGVGPEGIEVELARDTSGAAPEGAARCRAALPSLATKTTAWEAIFGGWREGDALSTYLVSATAEGFWQAEQKALLAPFVSRYFTAAVEVAARRGPSVATAVGRTGFPLHIVDADTLRAGEQCLADGDVTAALRRALADQLDDLRRALRVRSLHH